MSDKSKENRKAGRSRLPQLEPSRRSSRPQSSRLEQFSTLQQSPHSRRAEPPPTIAGRSRLPQSPGGAASHTQPPPTVEVEKPTLPTFKLKPGWSIPQEDIPDSTYWPVVMALGITFIAFGVLTNLLISALGLLLFIVALVGWIGDIRKEHTQHANKH